MNSWTNLQSMLWWTKCSEFRQLKSGNLCSYIEGLQQSWKPYINLKVILWGVSTPQRPKNCDNSKTTADKNLKFLTFIIWLSSKNWCHYYFVGCHLWRHHGHQRGTGRRRNYNFLTVHSIKQDIHFFTFVKMCVLYPIYVFEVGEFNGDTFRTIPPPVYLENPVRTGSTGTSRLPIFLPGRILWFYLHLCFRGRGIRWWHFQNSTTTGWPQKSSSNRKYWNFKVTHLSPW